MDHQTVDYGIDLGTTNSAIARATSGGVELIWNRHHHYITPSAVARTRAGQTLVGTDALSKPKLSPATQFKRLMGTTTETTLGDGTVWPPEALSAEILKDLKGSAQRASNTEIQNVVITVPAMFQQPQCEATHRAAELAGLTAVLLLQEPIAAATAFLNASPQPGNYLVYDLGGGTFDASIVQVRDDAMTVIAHGGDNYLGGSDFDRAVSEWALGKIKRTIGDFSELKTAESRFKFIRACEQARVELSDIEETRIDLFDLELDLEPILFPRSVLDDLISPFIARTIRLAKERISEAGLSASDIRRVLMVGGPTMTPGVRTQVAKKLEIPLSFDENPMTSVARGAAIAASSILIKGRSHQTPKAESVAVELHYEPVSPEQTCFIAGKVATPAGFAGEVRFVRRSSDWDSGWVPLQKGAFQCELLLHERAATEFEMSARDLTGRLHSVTPGSVTIRHGLAIPAPVAPYDYGVALKDGSFKPVITSGGPLPAAGTRIDLKAERAVRAGSTDSLPIYFLEGNSPMAADNALVGKLSITGTDLPGRSLAAGDTVEVRIRMDESRRITARVSLPHQDMDYKVPLSSIIDKPDVADIGQSYQEAALAIEQVKEHVGPEDEATLRQSQRELEQIEAEMERVERSEPGAAERVVQKLMPIKAGIRDLQSKYEIDAAYGAAMTKIENASALATQQGMNMELATLQEMQKEADRAFRIEDRIGLRAIEERADRIFWRLYTKTPECWIGFVEWLRSQRQFASEAIPYDEYVKRAGDCLLREDYEGTRLNGLQAMSYLPEENRQQVRYTDAGLTT